MSGSGAVSGVLWDADGVLQQVPASWFDLLDGVIGHDQATALLDVLLPQMEQALRGSVAMTERLPAALAERGLAERADEVSEIWGTIEVLEQPREFVRELRGAGFGCHLATNQDDLRTSYMRARMGYDELLDRCFYSCEVGAAKPDEEFFHRVAAELGVELRELVFVDDTLANVESARACGLPAVFWHHDQGVDALRDLLAEHGVGVF